MLPPATCCCEHTIDEKRSGWEHFNKLWSRFLKANWVMADEIEDTSTYVVVVNHEEQYSIWRLGRAIPLGWKELDMRGTTQECLAHIKQVWTDMRPLSLRLAMDARKTTPPAKVDRAVSAKPRKTTRKKGKRR